MKLSATEQESLVALLARIYSDIRELEESYGLLTGDGDFRPRIEYFHDAIRAFTSQDPSHYKTGGRLTVELLSYDVVSLRAIYAKPLGPFAPHTSILSASTAVYAPSHRDLDVPRKRPDRVVREQISDWYQRYAVLFSALLKPVADHDYQERVDDIDQDVGDLHNLSSQCTHYMNNKGSVDKMVEAVMHIEDAGLRHELQKFMHDKKYKRSDYMQTLVTLLKTTIGTKNKEIKAIEQAHMNYALAQLGIYEASKDLVKSMAKQGMNLVGKFVEASIADSKRDMGR